MKENNKKKHNQKETEKSNGISDTLIADLSRHMI